MIARARSKPLAVRAEPGPGGIAPAVPFGASSVAAPADPLATAAEIERRLARRGSSLAGALAARGGDTARPREVWDAGSDSLWLFHSHAAHRNQGAPRFDGEIGHFHTFLGAAGMPPGVEPLVLPEMAVAKTPLDPGVAAQPATHLSSRHRGRYGHIVGLSLGPDGRPLGLFTTNRWVTGELWYAAPEMARIFDRFRFDPAPPGAGPVASDDTLIGLWVTAMLAHFRPLVLDLLQERDAAIMDWRRRRSRQAHVFDDRRLEMPSMRALAPPD